MCPIADVASLRWINLIVLTVLISGNVLFHLEAHGSGTAEHGIRLGLAAIIMLIMIVGGRVVPSFTRNWLAREHPGRLPAPFGTFDVAALALGGAALVLWVALPFAPMTAAALIAAGIVQAAVLARWAGDRTVRDPLVLVLHLAYAFVPLGFALTGAAALGA